MQGFWETLAKTAMTEAFGVAVKPTPQQENPASLKNILIQETFGVATAPVPEKPNAVQTVAVPLLQEAGLLHWLDETTKATAPEPPSEVEAVIAGVANKIKLETIGTIAALTIGDVVQGVLKPTVPEPEKPNVIWEKTKGAAKWTGGKVKDGWTSYWTNRAEQKAAKKAAETQAEADAKDQEKINQALTFQNRLTDARERAANAEERVADASQRNSAHQSQAAAAAVVAADRLQAMVDLMNQYRQNSQNPDNRLGNPDIINGEAKD